MKNLNFQFPAVIIAFSVLLGFFLNYRNNMSWQENLDNMTSTGKIITYAVLFVVLFLWKNRKARP